MDSKKSEENIIARLRGIETQLQQYCHRPECQRPAHICPESCCRAKGKGHNKELDLNTAIAWQAAYKIDCFIKFYAVKDSSKILDIFLIEMGSLQAILEYHNVKYKSLLIVLKETRTLTAELFTRYYLKEQK